ncbi:MAG TPA: T9SS type A sorting domain-containing protein [Chitinophagaceae bacterium]|jgi:hypothetical protein|nr:T9SS type A sorting domain-containing protein [Chitinophagaceae bacterium]
MRKPLLIAGIALLLTNAKAHAQLLNWATSFLPSWANNNTTGSAPNIAGTGIASAVDIQLSGGSFTYANGIFGTMSPTVSGATATVPGSASRMQVAMNFANNTNTCTIKYTFTSQVTNLSFRISDIDKLSPTSFNYVDKITITGKRGASTFNPTITKYDAVTDPDFLVISGNTVNANPVSGQGDNTDSDASDQRGTVNVNFGTAVINEITIVYGNHSNAQTNPGAQFIAVGNMSFSASTLPVQLASFNGYRQTQDVVLNWKTMQENNAHSYNVERNTGSNWETIGTVNATGNTALSSNYTYTDINPQGSTLLYRLKQIDTDNNHKYSGIVRIITKSNSVSLVSYPNPFTDQINVNINSAAKQQVSATVYDVAGKTIRTESRPIYTGNNSFSITGLSRLERGAYYVQVKDAAGAVLGHTSLLKD